MYVLVTRTAGTWVVCGLMVRYDRVTECAPYVRRWAMGRTIEKVRDEAKRR